MAGRGMANEGKVETGSDRPAKGPAGGNEVARLRAMLDAIGEGARGLGAGGDWTTGMQAFLASLGRATAVSRVTLFEVHEGPHGLPVESCRCDWAEPGLAPLADDPRYTGIAITDDSGELDDWSRRRAAGETVGALLGETTGETRRIFEEHGTRSFISVPVHVDGAWWGLLGFDDCRTERRWNELEIEILRTSAALVAGAVGRARAERRIEESEARYALAAQGANDGLWDWDIDGGHIYYAPRLARILGRSQAEMGDTVDTLMTALAPTEGGSMAEVVAEALASPRRRFRAVCRVLPAAHDTAGDERWVVLRGLIVRRDGRARRMVGGLRDITEHKRTEIALRERTAELERSRRLMRDVIDAVPAVINVKDTRSRYLLMNRFQGTLYGVDPDAAIGRTSAEFTGDAYGGRSRELDLAVIESGLAQPFTERDFVDVEGRPHTWYTAKMPLSDAAGQVESVVTVALDITELKALERARAELSRYVAPAAAAVLASRSEPFGPPRAGRITVLFADIVGSSQLARLLEPREFFAMLRDCHGRLARAVFEHEGAIDKFTGDGIMATFGSPQASDDDARRALACARTIQKVFWEWNVERRAGGAPLVPLAIGLHHGPALLGNIGDETRMEFAALGDTVTLASRLEKLARPLDAGIVASEALIAAAHAEAEAAGEDITRELDGLVDAGPQALPGREEPVAVWILPRAVPVVT